MQQNNPAASRTFKRGAKTFTPLEILAPAGGQEALFAAVRCGADAVYLGLSELNARQGANNFLLTHEEQAAADSPPMTPTLCSEDTMTLAEAVSYAHLCGVKVYLTLNTLLFDEEFSRLAEMVQGACKALVDGIIVQDFGVWLALRQWCPTMPIHASTQMTVHTALGVVALEQLGFSRVVLARELSLPDLQELLSETADSSIETELFVHGSLCVSVSGQCYMSAFFGGRSANKGSCAGSCRQPFAASLKAGAFPHRPPPTDSYALSLKDNCLVSHGEELSSLGVTALKIEGRMKQAEYVAAAVTAYRQMRAGEPVDQGQLRAVFSRDGFTDRYFTGETQHDGGQLFGMRSKQDVSADRKKILQDLRGRYHKEVPRYPVTMTFWLRLDAPARLTLAVTTSRGKFAVTVTGDPPSVAVTTPLTLSLAEQILGKLGGTVFYLANFMGKIDPTATLKKSQLTALRREAVATLSEQLVASFPPIPCAITPISSAHEFAHTHSSSPGNSTAQTICRVRFATMDQLQISPAVLDQVSYFSLPLEQVQQHRQQLLPYRERVLIELDRVMFGREAEITRMLAGLASDGFENLSVSNLAHIELGNRLQLRLFGTVFLNVTNSYSVEAYRQMGLCQLELSMEARIQQLEQMASNHPDVPLGVIAYGHLPLMILRSCPLWQKGTSSCGHCPGGGQLIDRKGEQVLLLCHQKRYRELLNPRVLWLSDQQRLWDCMQVATLYFTVETAASCEAVLTAHLAGEPPNEKLSFTRGLYYRGIR